MITYGTTESSNGRGVVYWAPDMDVATIIDALPGQSQSAIKHAGCLIVDGSLGMTNRLNSYRRRSYLVEKPEDVLTNHVDTIISGHVWRTLESGIENQTMTTESERLQQALHTARAIRATTDTMYAERSVLKPHYAGLLMVARGIHDIAAIGGNDTDALVARARDEYTRQVANPLATIEGYDARTEAAYH